MARAKTKATNLRVPQNDAEAEQMIAQLGASQRDQAEAKARHDAVIADLETEHGKVVKAAQEEQAGLIEGISVWAAANRERLTSGGKTKTVQLASGTILWRDGRYAVKHRGLKEEDVVRAVHDRIDELREKAAGEPRRSVALQLKAQADVLEGCLRRIVKPNKDAMLAAREVAATVSGIVIER
ncbi:host-nuclease inhibitor Gam family protein, partial [Methylorubrum populi]|uniref:host-nuclease inhibitor Gam family protein n=1 Tax=Methylorubrum populi TaxID=223967 RepID=UPI000DB5F739